MSRRGRDVNTGRRLRAGRAAQQKLDAAVPLIRHATAETERARQVLPTLRALVEQVERLDERAQIDWEATRNGPVGNVMVTVDRRVWEHDLIAASTKARRLIRELDRP